MYENNNKGKITKLTDFFNGSKEFNLLQPDFELDAMKNENVFLICCSDGGSLVETFFRILLGEVFVFQNMANITSVKDQGLIGSLEYAVKLGRARHIVVCGHYGCNIIEHAMNESLDLGDGLNDLLNNTQDMSQFSEYKLELDSISNTEDRFKKNIELNVKMQCQNIMNSRVIQQLSSSDSIKFYSWVIDNKTGILKDIQF